MLKGYDEWKLQAESEEDKREVAAECAYCLDEILEGSEGSYEAKEDVEEAEGLLLCSLYCLARFTAKYEIDLDAFDRAEA